MLVKHWAGSCRVLPVEASLSWPAVDTIDWDDDDTDIDDDCVKSPQENDVVLDNSADVMDWSAEMMLDVVPTLFKPIEEYDMVLESSEVDVVIVDIAILARSELVLADWE